MKKIQLVIALFLGMVLVACNSESPKFVGDWKLDKMDLAGEEIYANALGKPKYYFNEDKTYEFTVAGQSEEGKWSFKNDVITLSPNDSKETKTLKLVEVDAEKFVYQTGDDLVSTVYLKK